MCRGLFPSLWSFHETDCSHFTFQLLMRSETVSSAKSRDWMFCDKMLLIWRKYKLWNVWRGFSFSYFLLTRIADERVGTWEIGLVNRYQRGETSTPVSYCSFLCSNNWFLTFLRIVSSRLSTKASKSFLEYSYGTCVALVLITLFSLRSLKRPWLLSRTVELSSYILLILFCILSHVLIK